jgi:hypothetical protein
MVIEMFMSVIARLIYMVMIIIVAYFVIRMAVKAGVTDAYHRIETEKKEKTRRLYDEK